MQKKKRKSWGCYIDRRPHHNKHTFNWHSTCQWAGGITAAADTCIQDVLLKDTSSSWFTTKLTHWTGEGKDPTKILPVVCCCCCLPDIASQPGSSLVS